MHMHMVFACPILTPPSHRNPCSAESGEVSVGNCHEQCSKSRWPVSAANPHLLRFSQICPRLATFWSFSLLRRNRRPAAQSQDQTYIFLMCRI